MTLGVHASVTKGGALFADCNRFSIKLTFQGYKEYLLLQKTITTFYLENVSIATDVVFSQFKYNLVKMDNVKHKNVLHRAKV